MKLAEYLDSEGLSARQFADRLGLTGSPRAVMTRVQRWKQGTRTPSPEMIVKITEATKRKVKVDDFVKP